MENAQIPMARKILCLTGTRADFGHLWPVLRQLKASPDCELHLLVSGTHLSNRQGESLAEIQQLMATDCSLHFAGIPTDNMTREDGLRSAAEAASAFAPVMAAVQPDLCLVLGDRYELMPFVWMSNMLNVPVAHIHGGELSLGAIDDAFRHAITKMSHLHFPVTREYQQRILQMGEMPARVFCHGAPGLDDIGDLSRDGEEAILAGLGIRNSAGPLIMVALHPETLSAQPVQHLLDALLSALQAFLEEYPSATCILTGSNADPEGVAIDRAFQAFVRRREGVAVFVPTLGRHRWFHMLSRAAMLVGNSSSGIIEAPALATASINVGDRQAFRARAASIIDVPVAGDQILAAMQKAMHAPWRDDAFAQEPVYKGGGAGAKIAESLLQADLTGLMIKHFIDQPPLS